MPPGEDRERSAEATPPETADARERRYATLEQPEVAGFGVAAPAPDDAQAGLATAAPSGIGAEATESRTAAPRRPPALATLHLDVQQARQVLSAWASHQLLVDEKIFPSDLHVDNDPLVACTLVRMIETREGKQDSIPAHQQLPCLQRYSVGLDAVTVPETTDFESKSWRLILAGSERQALCPAGCKDGWQPCKKCQGGQVRCASCGGTGKHRHTDYSKQRPVERVERCSDCAGSGTQPCRTCNSSGWVTCKTCQGAGALIYFVRGEIDHKPTPAGFSEPLPPEIKAKKITPGEWVVLSTTPGQSIPDLIPAELCDALSREIDRRPANELLRKLEVRGLAHAVVRLPDQPEASVRIVGKSRIVFASGVKSRKRIQWLVAGIVIIIVVVVVVIIVIT